MEPSFGQNGGWAPPPPPPPPAESETAGKAWVLILLGVIVVGGLAWALLVLLDPFGSKTPGPVAAPATTQAPQSPTAATPSTEAAAPTSSWSEKQVDPQVEAGKQLKQLRDEESGAFDSLMGSWSVQLASAAIGADDVAYKAKHEALASRWDVFLSTTDDFYNKRATGDTYWVTFAAGSFDSKDAADSWCSEQGLSPNDCLAREMRK